MRPVHHLVLMKMTTIIKKKLEIQKPLNSKMVKECSNWIIIISIQVIKNKLKDLLRMMSDSDLNLIAKNLAIQIQTTQNQKVRMNQRVMRKNKENTFWCATKKKGTRNYLNNKLIPLSSSEPKNLESNTTLIFLMVSNFQ